MKTIVFTHHFKHSVISGIVTFHISNVDALDRSQRWWNGDVECKPRSKTRNTRIQPASHWNSFYPSFKFPTFKLSYLVITFTLENVKQELRYPRHYHWWPKLLLAWWRWMGVGWMLLLYWLHIAALQLVIRRSRLNNCRCKVIVLTDNSLMLIEEQ